MGTKKWIFTRFVSCDQQSAKMRTTENTILCSCVLRFPDSSYSSVVLSSAAGSPPRNGWFGMSTTTTALRVWYCRRSFVCLLCVLRIGERSVGRPLISKLHFLPCRFCRFSVITTSIITKLTITTRYNVFYYLQRLQTLMSISRFVKSRVYRAFCVFHLSLYLSRC